MGEGDGDDYYPVSRYNSSCQSFHSVNMHERLGLDWVEMNLKEVDLLVSSSLLYDFFLFL